MRLNLHHFKGTEVKGRKGLKGKGKKLPPPPPEIKALRATWNAVIEVKEKERDAVE